jgi:hypothetical protein
MSDYTENCLIDYLFRHRAPGGLAQGVPWYVALSLNTLSDVDTGLTLVEPATFDYERYYLFRDPPPSNPFSAPVDGTIHNLSDFTWHIANVDWGTINGVCIVNAPDASADIIFWINIPPTPMQIGDIFNIPAGSMTIQLQ